MAFREAETLGVGAGCSPANASELDLKTRARCCTKQTTGA